MNPQEPTGQPQPQPMPGQPPQAPQFQPEAPAAVPPQPQAMPEQPAAAVPPQPVPVQPGTIPQQPVYGQIPQQPIQPAPAMPTMPMNAGAGAFNPANPVAAQESSKSYIAAVIMSWLVGVFGVDRFYLGYTGLGIAKLVTFGGLGIWAAIDFILIALGKVKDKDGLPLAGYQSNKKIGLILLAVYVLFFLYSLFMLPTNLKNLKTSTAAVGQSAKSISSVGGDQKRQNDIKALKSQMELYGLDHHEYPTFADVNDPSFRKAYLIGVSSDGFTDPSGTSDQLVSTPQAGAYAYAPSPIGCDNVKVHCTSYTLTAVLSSGQAYTEQALGF